MAAAALPLLLLLLAAGAAARWEATPETPYELPDGSIAVSIRNQAQYRCRCRMLARSWDGGESLPPAAVSLEPALPDPAVAAGALVSHGLEESRVGVSRVGVSLTRPRPPRREPDAALELRQRQHVVGAWPARVGGAQRVLGAGGAAPEEQRGHAPLVYLIYEKGRSVPTESVSLATISLAGDL
ncbi:hypothetical protein DUI87_00420 [Hirundo rustica rustica]|uniref:Uncharacterized protein n=1 Tax=Hirundo rustica rustica TaxID=333673 RepID=A0A3M0LF01_HIRRU|nr:hypothetical protein DUI87_00420 [Hirundo rustica rustica]